MRLYRLVRALLIVCTLPAVLHAAGTAEAEADRPSVADPGFLAQYAATYRFRLGHPKSIEPAPDGKSVLFLRSTARSFVHDLYEQSAADGRERVLLTADSILGGAEEQLGAEERARRERQREAARGIASYTLSKDGGRILVPLSGRLFVVDRASGKVRELHGEAGAAIDARFSPDGTRVACVRDGELYVMDLASGLERRLTSGAGGSVTNGLAEFVAQEEMSRHHGYWWSPDSRRIAFQQTDTAGVEVMHIMDAAHPEREPGAWAYPRPGRQNARVRLGLVAAEGGAITWVQWDRERYEYLATVKWEEKAPLTLLVQNRRQTEQRLLAVDATDGSTRSLLVERDEAWIDIDQSMPHWLPDGGAFLWISDRNGARQLELRDRDGTLRRALTPLDFGLRGFAAHLPQTGEVIVRASVDPTEEQLWRLPLDPRQGPPRRLTDEPGVHGLAANEDGSLFVHSVSPLAGESRNEILTAGGWSDLSDAIPVRSVAESPSFEPQLELARVGSDPELRAALIRPRNFERGARYPVIVHVYGGPTSQMVRGTGRRYLLDQWIADHGYVVVSIDGRGTPGRDRRWERAVKGDLIGIPLADQTRGLDLLGTKYDELDLSRVGIYGWSFGGYFSAMAVLREPDVFRVGVAGAPVVDWRDYDTHYTERYMDLPQDNPAGYEAANVLTYADQLARPLLIVHGTDDDNVYFVHSLKLVDALFRAGKRFDFLPLAGLTHMVPDPLVTERLYGRILDHFERHLKGGRDGR